MIKAQTLKGFRDFLPADSIKRQYVTSKIKEVFERFGFDPLETPALEYAETLLGKYGDEADKLLYLFEDRGGRKVGMRYDQTVPLARVIAQYGNELPMPFKRYQIQPVWRAENPQKGRYREFLQCDIDIVGTKAPLWDAEILAVIYETYKNLGLNVVIKINDRNLLSEISSNALTALDKLNKIGEEGVLKEFQGKGFSPQEATKLLRDVKSFKASEELRDIKETYLAMRYPKDSIEFEPTLVRGLDYYTGMIVEVILKNDRNVPSLGGGGRYDKLIGQFTGKDIPAVGFAFGFDRLLEAMEQCKLLPDTPTATRVLVTSFPDTDSITLTSMLRNAGINAETFYEPVKLDKQLKYADRKGIPYVVIQGPDEVNRGVVKLKNLKTQSQEELTIEESINKLSSN